jgi:hypothetical protein
MIFLKAKLRRLRRDSTPDQHFKAALRSRLLASNALMTYASPVSALRYAFAAVALVLVAGFGTTTYAYASPSVTEGDALYPVKTRLETMEARFHHSPEARARFEDRLQNRRFHELHYKLHHREPLTAEQTERYQELMKVRVQILQN